MEQRMSLLTLGVKDLARSKRFYADGLGWRPAYEDKQIVFFQAGGLVFALFLAAELAKDFNADSASFGRAPIAMGYNVRTKEEVDPLITRALSAGAYDSEARMRCSLGRLLGLLRRSRWFRVGDRLEPCMETGADGSVTFK